MFKSMRVTALAAALMAATSLTAIAEVVYHRGNTADPETLDQHKTSTTYEAHILRDLYEGLVSYECRRQGHSGRCDRLDNLRRRHGLYLHAA